jgi:hypothetical protein
MSGDRWRERLTVFHENGDTSCQVVVRGSVLRPRVFRTCDPQGPRPVRTQVCVVR